MGGRRIDRRMLLKLGALGAASGVVSSRALASHHPPPYPNRPPGHYPPLSDGGGIDEGDIPVPRELPSPVVPVTKTEHDRGDAVITRYQLNVDATNFGCEGDHRSGLVYVTQRLTDHIAVFDREKEELVDLFYVPTIGSGAHTVKIDQRSNSAWFAMGEASKVGRLVLDPDTLRPHNFVEYTMPGDVRPARKPHGLVVVGDEVWFTDDRGDRVGIVDVASGRVTVLDEEIEADGINVERDRVWIAGGATVTVIDVATREVKHRIPVPEEPGVSQLRLHDLHYDERFNRVWVLARGSDHIVWIDADAPERGPQEFINPAEYAAGLDHIDLGHHLWWTEGLRNNITRYDPFTKEVKGYEVPTPSGYFNPHGVWVSSAWREVWFTELESLCVLRFKDGRSP